jgi:hypothetical protein
LQYGGVAGSIVNQSSGFQVQLGNTLALVGGDVRLEGGILQAPGGRVELGGLAAAGIIELSIDGKNLRLKFPEGVARSDVFLSNQAVVRVDAGGGGDIAINARNLEMSEGSSLIAGSGIGLGKTDAVSVLTLNNLSAVMSALKKTRRRGEGETRRRGEGETRSATLPGIEALG